MSNLEVYYYKSTESPSLNNRISPSPTISISPEIYYNNDNVIGYTYNVTLNGYANALRKELNSNSTTYGLEHTVDHMDHIRNIFNFNGGNLYIKQNNTDTIVAKGCTVKNLSFETSNLNWINYAPFSIELEFNEIDFTGCSSNSPVLCSSSIFHQINNSKNISNNLVDITNYKIKEFNDKWTFSITDQIYEHEENASFNVSYSLSAVGKNYYVNDNLVPAWQQARLFVQNKLYNQVFSLVNGCLPIESNNNNSCDASKSLDQIHNIDNTNPRTSGLLDNFDTLRDGSFGGYDIYNETIKCDSSESDGSFSINYNCIVKRKNSLLNPSENSVTHSYTKNLTVNNDTNVSATISVQGTIQGLVRGGFIYYNNNFTLPANGTLLTNIDTNETKYSNALAHYQNIGDTSDFNNTFKEKLSIKKSQLLIKGTDGYPSPSSFTIDHNYTDGSVSYNATYDRSLAISLDKGFTNISITRNDPVDIIQEFIVPGRISGPIIQKLNTKTSRTVSVNIDGANPLNKGCSVTQPCNGIPYFYIENFQQLLSENNNWVKTKEDYTVNKIDGSFSISLEYIIRSC